MNFASDKYNAIQVKNFTLKVLSEAFFINSGVFLSFLVHAIVPKFLDTTVHDSYTLRHYFEKML